MDISEIKALHQRLSQRVRRLPDYESWHGSPAEAVRLLAKTLGGARHLARIIARENKYTDAQRQKLEGRINSTGYGIRDVGILHMVLGVWDNLAEKPSNKIIDSQTVEKSLPDRESRENLHQRVFRRVQKLPDHEEWAGTLSQAVHILAKNLGGATHLARIIARENGCTDEQCQQWENRINSSIYGVLDADILQAVLGVWESLDRKPSKKNSVEGQIIKNPAMDANTSKVLSASIRSMSQYKNWNGSYDQALTLLRKFVAAGMGLAHVLKELGLVDNERNFKNRFQVPFSRNALPAPEILALACVGWQHLLDQNKYDLDRDLPYKKANHLVRRLKGYEKWNDKKPLKDALAVLAEELGSSCALSSVLQKHKNYSEEEAKKFGRALSSILTLHNVPCKIETDLALELWELILDNPEIKKWIKPGSVDLDKDYPAATALVRRQLGMRDWNGTLDETIPILRRLGGYYIIAKMLNLSEDQEQRIGGFLRDTRTLNPREEDLQCALRAWSIILDRRARGVTGPALTAPVQRRISGQVVGSPLNSTVSDTSQHSSPQDERTPRAVGNAL